MRLPTREARLFTSASALAVTVTLAVISQIYGGKATASFFGKSPKAGTKCHPSLRRWSERQRWDVVNYLRTLGK